LESAQSDGRPYMPAEDEQGFALLAIRFYFGDTLHLAAEISDRYLPVKQAPAPHRNGILRNDYGQTLDCD